VQIADRFFVGDALRTLRRFPEECVDCVVTSPPYWSLRDYGVAGQLGLEASVEEYLGKILAVFAEVRRVLKPSGTCFVNLGDTYGGSWRDCAVASARSKCLSQVPSRFAIGMTDGGWILRNEIIWWKPACLPQAVKDRFTVDFEKLFFFTKSPCYFFAQQFEPLVSSPCDIRRMRGGRRTYNGKWRRANMQSSGARIQRAFTSSCKHGRNKRAVWRIPLQPFRGAHFATFPEALVETPILAGSPRGGIVLDPFLGSGTTAVVARKLGRRFVGIELNPAYVRLARGRVRQAEGRLR